MSDEHTVFWNKFLNAVRTEARSVSSIVGASGLNHPVLALGADDSNKRLVVISGEHDARASAMMQMDIQTTLPGVHVVVARPIAVGLPAIAESLIEMLGGAKIHSIQLQQWAEYVKTDEGKKTLQELVQRLGGPIAKSFEIVPLDILSQVFYAIKQLTYVKIESTANAMGETELTGGFDLSKLAAQDLMQVDREVGVCPLPLYAFGENDWEVFQSRSTNDIAEHLKQLGIFQYFFPPPDHAALGLIDRVDLQKDDISRQLELFPRMGHPMGDPELFGSTPSMFTVVDELQSKGFIVEGKADFSLTDAGRELRASVQFKPRESVLSKIINHMKINVNINNFFR